MSEQTTKYIFALHCLSDACSKCQALNGREWHDQDLFQNVLWDPIWGNIWDLNVGTSLMHPNCRCQLEVRVEIDVKQIDQYCEFHDLVRML